MKGSCLDKMHVMFENEFCLCGASGKSEAVRIPLRLHCVRTLRILSSQPHQTVRHGLKDKWNGMNISPSPQNASVYM